MGECWYPFMNPSPITNILLISSMLLLPMALIFVFGQMIGKKVSLDHFYGLLAFCSE